MNDQGAVGKDSTDLGGLENFVYDTKHEERPAWTCFGQSTSRSLVVFLCHMLLIFLIIIVAIVNLSLSNSCENTTLWVSILSSAVGYALPGPKL